MSDTKKNKDSHPDAGLRAATAKPDRSRIESIRRTRRGVRPERRSEDGPSQHPDTVSLETSPPEAQQQKALARIAAESVARDTAEKARLAAEADRAKLELAREKEERRAAAVDAEDRLAAVHRHLVSVCDEVAATRKSLSRQRKIRVAAGFAAAVLICAALVYRSMPATSDVPVAPWPPGPPRTARSVQAAEAALETPEARFTEGLDRLNLTLASAAGGKPEDAIRRIRDTLSPAVCPFVWRSGQVSLTFNEDTNLSSLASTFSRCADALERIP